MQGGLRPPETHAMRLYGGVTHFCKNADNEQNLYGLTAVSPNGSALQSLSFPARTGRDCRCGIDCIVGAGTGAAECRPAGERPLARTGHAIDNRICRHGVDCMMDAGRPAAAGDACNASLRQGDAFLQKRRQRAKSVRANGRSPVQTMLSISVRAYRSW